MIDEVAGVVLAFAGGALCGGAIAAGLFRRELTAAARDLRAANVKIRNWRGRGFR